MPEEARTIDPPGLFRSPRYANIVVAGGFAFSRVEVDAIVYLGKDS